MTDVWHNSGFNSIRQCEQNWAYNEIEGLESKGLSLPLFTGSWFHALMQAQGLRQGITQGSLLHGVPDEIDLGLKPHFTGPVPLDAFGDPSDKDFTRNLHEFIIREVHDYFPTGDETVDEMPHNVWFLYERYLAAHVDDLLSEKVLGVEVEWQREEKGEVYGGKADRIILRSDGLVTLRDYKTTGQIPNTDFRLANSQLHLYAWGLAPWLAEHGHEVDVLEYDYAYTYWPKMRVTKAGNLYSNQKVIDEYAALKMLPEALEEDGHEHTVTDERFEDYLQKCREEGNREFFPRHEMPVNVTTIGYLLDEQEHLIDRAKELIAGAQPVRNVGRHCAYACDYQAICAGEMYGNDVSPLKADMR